MRTCSWDHSVLTISVYVSLTSDLQGRARWVFSATCVSTPVTASTERPVIPSPGSASRTASSDGWENPPARSVSSLGLDSVP